MLSLVKSDGRTIAIYQKKKDDHTWVVKISDGQTMTRLVFAIDEHDEDRASLIVKDLAMRSFNERKPSVPN